MMISDFKKILFLILFTLTFKIFAQEKSAIDTSASFNFSIPHEILDYQINNPNSIPEYNKFSLNKYLTGDTSSIWMRARMMIGKFNNTPGESGMSPQQMMAPSYNCYLESQKLSALRTVLGAVQVGAVGYLAYKHIKKYGFLKKK